MSIELSAPQQRILDSILDWYKSKQNSYLTLGGYAGTGKTTLIAHLSELLHKEDTNTKIAFIAYTGKAARVLQQRLQELDAIHSADQVSTIHRLIYSPVVTESGEIIGWEKKTTDKLKYSLIIVDEASMLNKQIWQDLLSYKVPILAVGDHGQLPPIEGSFNLMEAPQLRLEEIYRQQQDNPIIQLSVLARNGEEIPFETFTRGVRKLRREEADTQEFLAEKLQRFTEDMLVLTGYNHTRVKVNKAIRGLLEFASEQPRAGDRVICLRNNHAKAIFNGMTGTILALEKVSKKNEEYYEAEILFDGETDTYQGEISVEQFGERTTLPEKRKGIDLFDFGYAVTTHKAQGSQAERVVVFAERFAKMSDEDWNRWLYTAITRAQEELYLVS